MSKPKKRKVSQAPASSQEEDYVPGPSAGATAEGPGPSADTSIADDKGHLEKAKKYFDKIDATLRDKRVCEVVRYLLCAQGKGLPVRRKDLLEKVLLVDFPDKVSMTRALPLILDQASDQLQKVFGLEVKKIKRGSVECYLLINNVASSFQFSRSEIPILKWSKSEKKRSGLLAVVLSLIMMKQGRISEDLLWSYLGRMKLSRNGTNPSFDDIEKLISREFVTEMYLDKIKQTTGDSHTFLYTWGPRAKEEVNEQELLKFVADTYGGDLASWQRHFKLSTDSLSTD